MMTNNTVYLRRGLAVWCVIILAESVHGLARELWLKPLVGDFRARQLAVFTGMVLILLLAWLFTHWVCAQSRRQLLKVGGLWVALTLAFEFGLGRFGLGYSWERMLEDYNLFKGGWLGLGLLFMFFAPLLAARFREPARPLRIEGSSQ